MTATDPGHVPPRRTIRVTPRQVQAAQDHIRMAEIVGTDVDPAIRMIAEAQPATTTDEDVP